jgi:hypothetical protein
MHNNLILFAALLAGCGSISARDIRGLVLADNDSSAVVGALCELKVNSSVVAKAVTNNDGSFAIDDNSKANANLVVSMTGYSNTEIFIPAGSKNIDLGTIYINNNVTLDELTVTAQQVMQGKEGRTIVIPSNADVKASSTALSLFDKLPLPGLDADRVKRKISVDGGTPVILINGVPSDMTDFNALQAKNIERIEYSRITPARYADKGYNGMVNIILKQRNDGGDVYAWMRGCPTTCFFDANVNATYHQGPSQFSLSYSPSWRNYQSVYDNEALSYIGNDFRVNLDERERNPFNYFDNPIRAKYNYQPNSSTLFSATFNLESYSSANRSIGKTIDSLLGDYDYNNKTTDKTLTPSLDLFLRRDFNNKNSLEVEVVGTLSSDDYDRSFIYTYPDESNDTYKNSVENRRRSLISEVSYIHSFSDKTTLSAGVQNTLSHTTNTYLASDYKPVLTENNNYVYAKLSQNVRKVYFSLSTGMKLFWMKNDLNDRNFVRNLSQFYIRWSINNNWSLQGSFSYRPSIPGISALTDYTQQQTQYTFSNGNPDLHTSNNFSYQIMPEYNYKKFSTSLLITYRDTRDPYMNQTSYLGDGLFLLQSTNYNYQRCLSGSYFAKISNLAGFGARANIYFERYWASGDTWNKTLTSLNGQISLWWSKGPITISYWRKFPGKVLSGYRVSKDENGDGFDIEYKPNSHWTLTGGWWYMFEKKGTKYPSWSYSQVNPYTHERYIKDNGNMIVLSVSYSLDFGTLFRTSRRNLNNSDSGSSLFKN